MGKKGAESLENNCQIMKSHRNKFLNPDYNLMFVLIWQTQTQKTWKSWIVCHSIQITSIPYHFLRCDINDTKNPNFVPFIKNKFLVSSI